MASGLLYVGTRRGLLVFEHGPEGAITPSGDSLREPDVRAIAIDPQDPTRALVGCGLRGSGLHEVSDSGRKHRALAFPDRWVWDVVFIPNDPERVLVGTEPPGLFVGPPEGPFEELQGIQKLPSRPSWEFGYEPFKAGHIHGVTFDTNDVAHIYACVEVGGFIYSRDGGRTWAESLMGHDLHRIALDPGASDHLLVVGDDGLYESVDAGATWRQDPRFAGRYAHGVAFDPHRTGRVLLAIEGEPIWTSEDAGKTWDQLPDAPPPALAADPFAFDRNRDGRFFYLGHLSADHSVLWTTLDSGRSWEQLDRVPRAWRIAVTSF